MHCLPSVLNAPYSRQLKNAGCKTALASNGLQAIQQIQKLASQKDTEQKQFDAILVSVSVLLISTEG